MYKAFFILNFLYCYAQLPKSESFLMVILPGTGNPGLFHELSVTIKIPLIELHPAMSQFLVK